MLLQWRDCLNPLADEESEHYKSVSLNRLSSVVESYDVLQKTNSEVIFERYEDIFLRGDFSWVPVYWQLRHVFELLRQVACPY